MNEELAKNLYDIYMEDVNRVYSIISDYFGEQNTDIKGFTSYQRFCLILNSNIRYFIGGADRLETLEGFDEISDPDKARKLCRDDTILYMADYLDLFFPVLKHTIKKTGSGDGYIVIHFPEVTVMNEYGKSIKIKDLYVRLNVSRNGILIGSLQMIRSTYSITQFRRGYRHSHLPKMYASDLQNFSSPCLGSGPIRATISSLNSGNYEELWRLFCLELDRYVKTESIAGRPFIRLETVVEGELIPERNSFDMSTMIITDSNMLTRDMFMEFIEYVLDRNILEFNFINGSFGFAFSYSKLRIILSNAFIEWINSNYPTAPETLITEEILTENIVQNGTIYSKHDDVYNINNIDSNYEGKYLYMFKGKSVNLHIERDKEVETDNNTVLLLHRKYIEIIGRSVLFILNSDYGKNETGSQHTYYF